MSNTSYLEFFNNLVDMASAFKDKICDKAIVDIVTEGKYHVGRYYILHPYKKEIVE